MSIFGRRQDQSARPRTAEERERARLEREARRAAREGRPAPVVPPPDEAATSAPAEDAFEGPPVAEGPGGEAPPVAEDPIEQQGRMEEGAAAGREPALEAVPGKEGASEELVADGPSGDAPEVDEPAAHEAGARPAPTLDEELASVDQGWFDDGGGREREPGQETVEWDVPANRPKTRPQSPAGPAGVDTPTVEWDVMAEQPKAPVRREGPSRVARGATATAQQDPPGAPGDAAASPASGAAAVPPAVAARRGRFDDANERPVPTRRVNRSTGRTLPPPPPAPGDRPHGGRFRFRRVAALVVLLTMLAAAAFVLVSLFQPLAGEGGEEVRVDVPRNATASEIGDILAERGIVDSGFFFTLRARLDGGDMQAGEYSLRRDMPYGDALRALTAGPPPPRTISLTIPEGRARRETAPLVRDAGLNGSYLAATERAPSFDPRRYGAPRGVASLEGFLFPATYELEPGATARALVRKQLQAFRENIARVSMSRARRRNLSTYDVLIIASMVEREATLDRERPQIAAVIHNRLRQGMPLGIDATIRFATRNWTEPLKQSELAIDSPYNTRRRTGLPPTPIGSPGLASIEAAADPANVDHLFYVVKPCGEGAHSFSNTDAEFQRDVAAYNRKREQLGGKSPVEC